VNDAGLPQIVDGNEKVRKHKPPQRRGGGAWAREPEEWGDRRGPHEKMFIAN
jgi:hypothetical protein